MGFIKKEKTISVKKYGNIVFFVSVLAVSNIVMSSFGSAQSVTGKPYPLQLLILAFAVIRGVMSKPIIQKKLEIVIKPAIGANEGNVFSPYMMIGGKSCCWGCLQGYRWDS